MKGRKAKPLEVHAANGNPSKKNLKKEKDATPRPPDSAGVAPSRLSAYGRMAWDVLFPVLQQMRVMSAADEFALEELCGHIADAWYYRRELATLRAAGPQGDLIEGAAGNVMIHPYAKMVRESSDRALKFMTEFGLTPSARTRIHVASESGQDDFLQFVAGLN